MFACICQPKSAVWQCIHTPPYTIPTTVTQNPTKQRRRRRWQRRESAQSTILRAHHQSETISHNKHTTSSPFSEITNISPPPSTNTELPLTHTHTHILLYTIQRSDITSHDQSAHTMWLLWRSPVCSSRTHIQYIRTLAKYVGHTGRGVKRSRIHKRTSAPGMAQL